MTEYYWVVRLEVFSFDTEEEACKFRDKLIDVFTGMPEAATYAGGFTVRKEQVDD